MLNPLGKPYSKSEAERWLPEWENYLKSIVPGGIRDSRFFFPLSMSNFLEIKWRQENR